jgi:hypothetical protein
MFGVVTAFESGAGFIDTRRNAAEEYSFYSWSYLYSCEGYYLDEDDQASINKQLL